MPGCIERGEGNTMSVPRDVSASAQSITFPFGTQAREAYLARPAGDGPFPGIVVIHEIDGLNDHIRDVAARFARQGYVALAVDLLAGRNRAACMARFIGQLVSRSPNNSSVSELKAALTHLAAQPGVDPSRLGAVGFCMGGSFAVLWACTDNRLKAIAPFYAQNPRPLEAARRMCPVVGSYPEKDFTARLGRTLDAALVRYAIPHDIKIYPGARHSFFNDQGKRHDPAASADAWARVTAFFAARLY
jgi:carboxymethylenebutenolidase